MRIFKIYYRDIIKEDMTSKGCNVYRRDGKIVVIVGR
jgi:hypothetical protein